MHHWRVFVCLFVCLFLLESYVFAEINKLILALNQLIIYQHNNGNRQTLEKGKFAQVSLAGDL